MVLESLLNPRKAEGRPKHMIWLGALYTAAAIIMAIWTFPSYSTMVFVALAAMAAIPLMYHTIKNEEKKDLKDLKEVPLLKEHGKALKAFMYLFIGMTLASAVFYVFLPSEDANQVFSSQIEAYQSANPSAQVATGHATEQTLGSMGSFTRIFLNNVRVTLFCAIFSFLYGAGAIFVMSWNASVIGFAIGNSIRNGIAQYAHLVGLDKIAQYFNVVSVGLLQYIIHGIPEILGYFVAGLAGGIIGIAAIRHDFGSKKFDHIVMDSADLFILSLVILLIAAGLEVWVTPLFF